MIEIGVFEGGSAVIVKEARGGVGGQGYYGNENEQDGVAVDMDVSTTVTIGRRM